MATSAGTMELEGWALRSIQTLLSRELPEFKPRLGSGPRISELKQSYFRLFRILECISVNNATIHAAFRADNNSFLVLTGRQQALRLMAAIDPVNFRSADDVLEFAAFADLLTTEDSEPARTVSAVDEIPCPPSLAKHQKAVIEMVQDKFRNRVQPVDRQMMPFGFQERFHVISTQRLIERTRMIASGGLFFRQDEILADNLPVPR